MNATDHPDINRTLKRPIFQDYGFDEWKASREELEATFMEIISTSLEQQRQDADMLKGLISHYGPLITEVPYKGMLADLRDRFTSR